MPKRKPSSKNSTAKFPVANENDGNWRKAPKSALADRLERFVKHASEMLALEREAEACTAANLLLQEQSEYPSCPVVLPGAENTPEGTSVGRAGALMEGLMLVGALQIGGAGTDCSLSPGCRWRAAAIGNKRRRPRSYSGDGRARLHRFI